MAVIPGYNTPRMRGGWEQLDQASWPSGRQGQSARLSRFGRTRRATEVSGMGRGAGGGDFKVSAAVYLFLSSTERAGHVTGAMLPVDAAADILL